jgi:hypothetical protein
VNIREIRGCEVLYPARRILAVRLDVWRFRNELGFK